jgi:hypothetical protein
VAGWLGGFWGSFVLAGWVGLGCELFGEGSWDLGGFMWVFFSLLDLWYILATCWVLLYLQAVLEIPVYVAVEYKTQGYTLTLSTKSCWGYSVHNPALIRVFSGG